MHPGTCQIQLSEGISKHQQLKKKSRHYSSQYNVRLSVHPNDLVVNFTV
jgi:hypothetical protein